jgi:hypothetical protein
MISSYGLAAVENMLLCIDDDCSRSTTERRLVVVDLSFTTSGGDAKVANGAFASVIFQTIQTMHRR